MDNIQILNLKRFFHVSIQVVAVISVLVFAGTVHDKYGTLAGVIAFLFSGAIGFLATQWNRNWLIRYGKFTDWARHRHFVLSSRYSSHLLKNFPKEVEEAIKTHKL